MNLWELHYEFGIHHIYIKVEFDQLQKVLDSLSLEFEIFQDENLIYIFDYYDRQHIIARRIYNFEDILNF